MTKSTATAPDTSTVTESHVAALPEVSAIVAAIMAEPMDPTAYIKADRSLRAKVRTALDKALMADMKAHMEAGDLEAATAAMGRVESVPAALKAASGATPSAPAIDWSALRSDRAAALLIAARDLMTNEVTIDGMPDDVTLPALEGDALYALNNVVSAHLESSGVDDIDGTDEARAESIRKAAADYATKRATRRGPTNNVAEAIVAALREVGLDDDGNPIPVSVAAIRRHWVENGGPANGDGRIAARLFATDEHGNPACTVPGVVPVAATATAPRGAMLMSGTDA